MPGFSTRSIGEENIRLPRRKPKMPGLPLWMERVRQHIIVLIKRAWARLARRRTGAEWRMFVLKLFALIIAFLAVSFFILWITLPNIDDPSTMFPSQSTVILDRNGVELYRLFSEQDRTYVAGDLISDSVKKATIAIEDERFFDRGCFDAIGFVRAGLSQFFPSFLVRSGGSTLTQQFAKNALVGSNRSLVRKVRELMLACELERKYNKEQLLELYLNWIPFGSNAYGIEQASKAYFAVSAKDLTLAQSVALAGLLQRPSYFNPYGYHVHTAVSDRVLAGIRAGSITAAAQIADADIKIGLIGNKVGSGSTPVYIGGRTDQVLQNMVQQKMISEEDRNKALIDLQKMKFAPERQNIRAPHFVLAVEQQVQTLLGIDPNDAKAGEHILEQLAEEFNVNL
jgi:membrane peptidoglycan carboxypeptidase